MKKKIVGIFVMTLLIISIVLPVVMPMKSRTQITFVNPKVKQSTITRDPIDLKAEGVDIEGSDIRHTDL